MSIATQNSSAIVPVQERMDNLKNALTNAMPSIRAVAANALKPERLIKVAVAACSRNPILLQCTASTVVRSVIQACELGLEAGSALGEAYLVPFKNNQTNRYECQMIPGYRGLIALARRSGQIAQLEARVVYDGDEFDVAYGMEPTLIHRPSIHGDRGKLAFVYAIARFVGGGTQWEVMTHQEIESIRMRSQTGRQNKGPWNTDYEEMARKTVVKRLVKYLPLSVEMAQAVALDNAVEDGTIALMDDVTIDADAMTIEADEAASDEAPILGVPEPKPTAKTQVETIKNGLKSKKNDQQVETPVSEQGPSELKQEATEIAPTNNGTTSDPYSDDEPPLDKPVNGIAITDSEKFMAWIKVLPVKQECTLDNFGKAEIDRLRVMSDDALAKRGMSRQ